MVNPDHTEVHGRCIKKISIVVIQILGSEKCKHFLTFFIPSISGPYPNLERMTYFFESADLQGREDNAIHHLPLRGRGLVVRSKN